MASSPGIDITAQTTNRRITSTTNKARGPRARRSRACTLALVVALTASGCGLQATPLETRKSVRVINDVAGEARGPGPAASSLERAGSEFPDASTLLAISRQAVRAIANEHRGFLPSITAVSECYETRAQESVEGRVYCLQLDGAALLIESMMPADWREMDAQANDYFTEERFYDRQWANAPPAGDADEIYEERGRNLRLLRDALVFAVREYAESLAPAAPQPSMEEPAFQDLGRIR